MAKISLTQGRVALIDEEDVALISSLKWQFSSGYASHNTSQDGKQIKIYMHRLIMGARRGEIVDHINGDTLDNRRANLRIATKSENAQNSRIFKNVFRVRGVESKRGRFRASIMYHGKRLHLGSYSTFAEAAAAYDRKALELFGPSAATNERALEDFLCKLKKCLHK